MTRLVVCRHPDPASADEASRLVDALSSFDLVAVYSSPLARAHDVARRVADAKGVAIDVVPDLREIELGAAEGVPFDDLPQELRKQLLEAPARVRFPGGETYGELRERVVAAVERIVARHDGATVAAVTHAGPIRALLATWLLMDERALFRLDQRTSAVNVVDVIDGTPFVRVLNAPPEALRADAIA